MAFFFLFTVAVVSIFIYQCSIVLKHGCKQYGQSAIISLIVPCATAALGYFQVYKKRLSLQYDYTKVEIF